jgi:hypothetical protein
MSAEPNTPDLFWAGSGFGAQLFRPALLRSASWLPDDISLSLIAAG